MGEIGFTETLLEEFDAVKRLPAGGDTLRIALGDQYGILRVLEWEGRAFREVWRSRELRSPIREVFVEDIDMDGRQEIIVYTTRGWILFFSVDTYERLWESPENEYSSIRCMALANIDSDPQKELIICSPAAIHAYDPIDHLEEWRSDRPYLAQEMVVGDVDDDGVLELVLNTGPILDSRFFDLEWEGVDYGERIKLVDIDDDGIPEVIGQSAGRIISVYDIDMKQVKVPY
ncbi:hypothetical protein HN588_00265 [Candidatus Bathyarchaeota archaeon]|nr:hypothetical protein [Candidatus Bathyarchaeota archaeon]